MQPAPTPAQWKELQGGRPAILFYWYRQRPEALIHRLSPNDIEGYGISGMVTIAEPPLTSGELCLIFDGTGRLIELHARPPLETTDRRADWKPLFDAAGLKADELRMDQPVKDPGTYADERAAWLLPPSDDSDAAPQRQLRVEAAARNGRPVYFWVGEQIAASDDRPPGDRSNVSDVPADLGTRVSEIMYTLLRLLAITVGAWMAWRNVRRGVANRTGAMRLALLYGAASLLSWLFLAHHTTSLADEWAILAATVGAIVLNGLTLWVIYLALEPSVRRHLPEWMISWNRLLDGRWRDPAVGRDILFGAALGVLWAVLIPLQHTLIPEALGQSFVPYAVWTVALTNGPVGLLFSYVSWPPFFKLLEFFMVVILYVLSGRRLAAAIVFWALIWMIPLSLVQEGPVFGGTLGLTAVMISLAAAGAFLSAITLVRGGLLGFVVFGIFGFTLLDLPITLDVRAWYLTTSCCTLAALAAIVLFAFTTATGGLQRLATS
jgi:serine/threonine-protein kinase